MQGVSVFLDIVVIVVLVLLNAFFVAAEFAIVKVRATQIETLVKANNRRARVAREILGHLDAYLSASQLGITMASIALGWVGEPVMAKLLEPLMRLLEITNPHIIEVTSFTIGFSLITFIHITLGEQAPKYAAIQYAQTATLGIAYPLKAFYVVFKPIIGLLNIAANGILRLVGINPVNESELKHSEEEIRLLIADGQKTGVIDAVEYRLIENIFDFTETSARELMVPRTDIFALDGGNDPRDNVRLAIESGYTRIPVYRETIDTVIGILYVKDLFKVDLTAASLDLEKILRPVYFTPETTSISRLMHDFLQQKIHLGIVIDEFGGTSGLITLENIIEKIVGQIQDEYDDEKKDFESLPDGSFLVNGKMRIAEFNRQFQANLPEDAHYETVAGFLYDFAGRIPATGETIAFGALSFKVTRKSPKQVQQVQLTWPPAP